MRFSSIIFSVEIAIELKGAFGHNEISNIAGFYEAIQFFPNYSDRDKIIAYSVLGGIPHYLKQFDSSLTLAENVKKNILTKGCALYSEVEFLLRQELRETPLYNSIIEAVALGNTKLNEISVKSLVDDTPRQVFI